MEREFRIGENDEVVRRLPDKIGFQYSAEFGVARDGPIFLSWPVHRG